jgi:hypothetical protein
MIRFGEASPLPHYAQYLRPARSGWRRDLLNLFLRLFVKRSFHWREDIGDLRRKQGRHRRPAPLLHRARIVSRALCLASVWRFQGSGYVGNRGHRSIRTRPQRLGVGPQFRPGRSLLSRRVSLQSVVRHSSRTHRSRPVAPLRATDCSRAPLNGVAAFVPSHPRPPAAKQTRLVL